MSDDPARRLAEMQLAAEQQRIERQKAISEKNKTEVAALLAFGAWCFVGDAALVAAAGAGATAYGCTKAYRRVIKKTGSKAQARLAATGVGLVGGLVTAGTAEMVYEYLPKKVITGFLWDCGVKVVDFVKSYVGGAAHFLWNSTTSTTGFIAELEAGHPAAIASIAVGALGVWGAFKLAKRISKRSRNNMVALTLAAGSAFGVHKLPPENNLTSVIRASNQLVWNNARGLARSPVP